MKNCFLINISESPECIINKICNIKTISSNNIIVLYISETTKEIFMKECSKLNFNFFDRVSKLDCFINQNILKTKWGYLLAEVFISSFKYIRSLERGKNISKVILNSNNQLYLKMLDQYLEKYDVGCYNLQSYKDVDFYPENNLINYIYENSKY